VLVCSHPGQIKEALVDGQRFWSNLPCAHIVGSNPGNHDSMDLIHWSCVAYEEDETPVHLFILVQTRFVGADLIYFVFLF
jgi:hypothetical protein